MIGEALRRLVGRVLLKGNAKECEGHFGGVFAPGRVEPDNLNPNPNPNPNPNLNHVKPAKLGVVIKGGLGELVHVVTAALQCHPVLPNPGLDDEEGWVCVSLDFKNFFNSISRPADTVHHAGRHG